MPIMITSTATIYCQHFIVKLNILLKSIVLSSLVFKIFFFAANEKILGKKKTSLLRVSRESNVPIDSNTWIALTRRKHPENYKKLLNVYGNFRTRLII